MLLLAPLARADDASAQGGAQAIRALLMEKFDRPPAALAKAVAAAEAKLPAEQAHKLSLFEGVMQMDADGAHPPHAHGGSAK